MACAAIPDKGAQDPVWANCDLQGRQGAVRGKPLGAWRCFILSGTPLALFWGLARKAPCSLISLRETGATEVSVVRMRRLGPLTPRAVGFKPAAANPSRAASSLSATDKGISSVGNLLQEYLPILVFAAMSAGLALVLILAAVVVAVRNPDPEKVSAYECGFNAFDDARMKFDVRFYLVSILFIIFDLEVAFLFPWATSFATLSEVAFWSMMVFLGVLTVGFAYEWKKGALEWA